MTTARLAAIAPRLLSLSAVGTALLLVACGGASDTSSSSSGAAGGAGSGGALTVASTQTSAGMVLTGPSGKTVYVLLDSSGHPVACSGQCLSVWPPLTGSGSPQAGSGVTASLASSAGANGASQVTANGNPLYYFSHDSAAGQANGQGIKAFGGTWYAVQPSGQPLTSSSGSGQSPTSTPGGGYAY